MQIPDTGAIFRDVNSGKIPLLLSILSREV